MGLEETGVEVDEGGYIRVNERLQTSAAGIWAMENAPGALISLTSRLTTSGSFSTI
jgi:thioredoxin reductase